MITFNNIPTTRRTPGVLAEIDNARALKGLFSNPHKALIIADKWSDGTMDNAVLKEITSEALADGYFGEGSVGARMCKTFKKNNPNTELWAIALSTGTVRASGTLSFGGSVTGAGYYVYALVGGEKVYSPMTSGWSATDIASGLASDINANTELCCIASTSATCFRFIAKHSGTLGNQFDLRLNFYEGQSSPSGVTYVLSGFEGGVGAPDYGDVWTVIDGIQFQHIVAGYNDSDNRTEIATELNTRFGPLVDLQGHCYMGLRANLASAGTVGNSMNSPHLTILPANGSPTNPEQWAAALGAVAAEKLNEDPGRPLQHLRLKGVIAPSEANRWTQEERNTLLYDGCATFFTDSAGDPYIERCITTYKTNSSGVADVSYLDIETLFLLLEIRYQFKTHMLSRFISQRYKLADDSFQVQAGMYVATPKTIRQEIIGLFTKLYEKGWIENLDEFATNLKVERDSTDTNRVNVLLPPDLINQFRILAGTIQFLL